jgi:hypothetical protein
VTTLFVHSRGRADSDTERWGARSIKSRSGVAFNSGEPFAEAVERRSSQPTRQIIDDLHEWGLGNEAIASVAGVSRQSVHKWASGESDPARDRWVRIVRLAAVCERVARKEDVGRWLSNPIPGSLPQFARIDFARVNRFDLLVKMLDHKLDPAKAVLEAFPGRPRPVFETIVSACDEGLMVELPALGVFGVGSTLDEAQSDLIAVVRDVVRADDGTDPVVSAFRPYLHSDEAIHRAMYGW